MAVVLVNTNTVGIRQQSVLFEMSYSKKTQQAPSDSKIKHRFACCRLQRGNSTMQLRRIKSGENCGTSCSFHGRPPCQYIIHILGHQPDGCLFFFLKILLPASLTYLFFQHSMFHETINVRTLDSVFHVEHHNGFPFHRCLSSWQHKMHKKKCKK